MPDRTHGLKDLFGSVPDDTGGAGKADAKGASPTPTSPSAPMPAATPPAPAAGTPPKTEHGLAAAFGGNPGPSPAAPKAPPTIDAPNLATTPADIPVSAHPGSPLGLNTEPNPLPGAPLQGMPATNAPAPTSALAPGMTVPLTCVVIARGGSDAARRTVQSLRLQTEAPSLELIVVADANALQVKPDGLAGTKTIEMPSGASYGQMAAAGVAAANGDLVALLDDYAFPARDWAATVMTHRHDRFAALGSALVNANPRSPLSWGNMLMEYGSWREGFAGGEVNALPARNLVYRREAMMAQGDDLAALLDGDGALLAKLQAEGQPLKLQEDARLSVLNPSTFGATFRARYAAGRLDGAAKKATLGLPKRISKAAAAALGGWARYHREKGRIFAGSDAAVNPKIQGGAVRLGMIAEGLGRAAGLLRGPGKAEQTRERLTTRRLDMLNKVDREQFGH